MNIELSDIVIALLILLAIWGWWCNSAVRERATMMAKQHCHTQNVQFLDESVSGSHWRITWYHGKLSIKRTFQFEFSSTGRARYKGDITFIGNSLQNVWLSPHDI